MNVMISCEAGGDTLPAQLVIPEHSESKADAMRLDAEKSARKAKTRKTSAREKKSAGIRRLPETLSCDSAAKYVAQRMAKQLCAPLVANPYSLDLIDVSRSLHHRQLFPLTTRSWPEVNRRQLIDLVYQPYREQVRRGINALLVRSSFVVHLSVRTFDLRSKKGKLRRTDVGLLYDPARQDEVDLCLDWYDEMYYGVPILRVRRNYPRRGTTDSITKAMRAEFSEKDYIGIELLLNRAWAGRAVAIRDEAIDGICGTLVSVLGAGVCEAA